MEIWYSSNGTQTRILFAVSIFPNTVSLLIQSTLFTIANWCNEVGLSVNVDKTGLLISLEKLAGFFDPQL